MSVTFGSAGWLKERSNIVYFGRKGKVNTSITPAKLKRGNDRHSRKKKHHGYKMSNEKIEKRTEKQNHFCKRNHQD